LILTDFFFLPALEGYLTNMGNEVYLPRVVYNFYYLTNPLKGDDDIYLFINSLNVSGN